MSKLQEHRHTKIYCRGSINLLMVTEAFMGATFSINMRVNLRYYCEFSVKGAAGARTEHLPSNPAAMSRT